MEHQPLIDQSLFQILTLVFSGVAGIIFWLGKISINSFTKTIKESYQNHEDRMNSLHDVIVDHEKRITENAKDIASNGAQDLLKMDNVARSMDDVKFSLKELSRDVKGVDKRLTDYIIGQK